MSKIKDALTNDDKNLDKWNVLIEKSQLNDILKASAEKPQLIYKHSHTCGTCLVAKREIEANFDVISDKAGMNFVNVIKAREVSNMIENELGVRHESPQVLIIKSGKCMWDESHFAIKAESILEVLGQTKA